MVKLYTKGETISIQLNHKSAQGLKHTHAYRII